MGLDQYLHKQIYIGGQYAENKEEFINVKKGERTIRIKVADIESIRTEVCYWRKNYAINEWFLDKIQPEGDDNCIDFPIEKEWLYELTALLKNICDPNKTKKQVLEIVEDRIPTHSWFTIESFKEDYDYYMDDFKDTLKKLEEIIKAPDFDEANFYYYIWY